jgi:hypothetical protein
LRGLATSAVVRGEFELAARLLGAAEAIDEKSGWPDMDAHERQAVAATTALSRSDAPEIAAAREAGRAMSDSEAAAYALATVAEQSRERHLRPDRVSTFPQVRFPPGASHR